MKNILTILSICWTTQLSAQQKIYDIELQSVDDKVISLAECKGKKILIAVASPEQLEIHGLQFLDSMQQILPDIKVLVIPANDFGGDRNEEILQSVRSNTSKEIAVAALSYVAKKGKEGKQNALMSLLTDVKQNMHFDDDVNADFHLYVISESGVLYASLSKGVNSEILRSILQQEDIKQ